MYETYLAALGWLVACFVAGLLLGKLCRRMGGLDKED